MNTSENPLRTCKLFHFAGHGRSNPLEPSQSCLLLEDWKDNPLTVGDLRDHRLQENFPFLGYLSACSTGANEVDRLIDEGIHLVSACQLAGFRHVVGTLWEVSDRYCVDVAKIFYETLRDEGMTDVAVCRGLHLAIRTLRDGDTVKRVTEKSDTARRTNVHHNRTKTANSDDNSMETMQEDCNPSDAGNENNLRVMRAEDAPTCEERDATLIGGGSREREQEKPLYWVPYIHFGV
jgi:CHAT domain-containing protein